MSLKYKYIPLINVCKLYIVFIDDINDDDLYYF